MSGSSRPTLLSYENTAEWHQGNEFIRHGYRPESNSTRKCFASWLYVHNETVNIYSHLLPAAFFLIAGGIMYQHFRVGYPQATAGDRLVFAFFLLTAATCLGISATYHTLMNHSIHVSSVWLRLDWVGIVILIFGDSVSGIYMGLYCEPKLQRINWSMVQVFIIVGHMLLIGIPYRSSRWVLVRLSYYLIPPRPSLAYSPCLHFYRYWSLRLRANRPRRWDFRLFPIKETIWSDALHWWRAIGTTWRLFLHC